MKNLILCLALMPISAIAADFMTSGQVRIVRMHSQANGLQSVQGVLGLQLDNAFSSRCLWLVVNASDKNTISAVFTAKAKDAIVVVRYSDAAVPPWGDTGSCYLTAIDY